MLILNTCSFQKKILFNLTCVLIYSLTKCVFEDEFEDICVLKILQNLPKNIHGGVYSVTEVAVCRVVTFLNKALRQI